MSLSNKEVATEFLKLAATQNVREGYKKYVAPNFKHHNPYFKGDAESLMIAMEENAKAHPNKILKIHQVIEEGDRVAILSCVNMSATEIDIALVHIFKIENGRIIELWDVGQAVPGDSPNENGMF